MSVCCHVDPELSSSLSLLPQRCEHYPFWNKKRQQIGDSLQVHIMLDSYQGFYYCTVHYQRGGKSLKFTRRLNVTAVCETLLLTVLMTPVQMVLTVSEGNSSSALLFQIHHMSQKNPASSTWPRTRSSLSNRVGLQQNHCTNCQIIKPTE